MPPELPVRPVLAALSLASLVTTHAWSAGGAAGVAPASLTLEVASERMGAPSRKVVAKVRPGDQVLLRDERETPYVIAAGKGGSRTASATSGLVATVTAVESGGGMSFRIGLVAREVAGFEHADYAPVPGGETFKVSYPRMSEKAVDETVTAVADGNGWRARKELPGSGFAVSILARPIPK